MFRRKSIQRAAALIGCATIAYSHGIETHKNITRKAVEYLIKVAPQEFGCASSTTLTEYLLIGTEHEDDDWWPEYFPLGRFFFHFHPALNAAGIRTTCNSVQWGFGGIPSSGGGTSCRAEEGTATTRQNEHRWQDAVRNARTATGEPSAEGWKDLGWTLHLLEDLTSPAHTRNDPHPPFDGDPVEKGTRTVDALPSEGLINDITQPEQFLNRLQNQTSSRFYSKDTVFHPDHPGPTARSEDGDYFYEGEARTGRRLAYKGTHYYVSFGGPPLNLGPNPRAATINRTIAREQFEELGLAAVRYAASFLYHYFKTANPAIPGCTSFPNQQPTAGFVMSAQGTTPVMSFPPAATLQRLNLLVNPGEVPIVSFNALVPGPDGKPLSRDPEGGALSFTWTSNNTRIPNATFTGGIMQFGLGAVGSPHRIRLVVKDSGDLTAGAEAEVVVTEIGTPTLPRTSVMNQGRVHHTATLLDNGTVLVTGGGNNTAEIYDPQAGTWRYTRLTSGQQTVMSEPRQAHAAIKLQDGKVLLVGGNNNRTAEMFDPATEQFTPTALTNGVHSSLHPGVLLTGDRPMVVGGSLGYFGAGMSEIYDRTLDRWTATPSIGVGVSQAAAVALPAGAVLAFGGYDGFTRSAYPFVKMYNAATNTVANMADMLVARLSTSPLGLWYNPRLTTFTTRSIRITYLNRLSAFLQVYSKHSTDFIIRSARTCTSALGLQDSVSHVYCPQEAF